MSITISESGMLFGPYEEQDCFEIEKSLVYKKIQQDTKIAEFLLFRMEKNMPVISIIEAKKSSPRNTIQFVDEIQQKLSNSLALFFAVYLDRHLIKKEDALPASFKNIDLATIDFRLVLVINECEPSWLPPLQDALKKLLRRIVKTWALSPNSVVVLNSEMAAKRGLTS